MLQVLIIDDEHALRQLLADELTRKGFEVSMAASGQEAIELLKTQHPKLILLDVAMPGLSGIETAQQIRTFDTMASIALLKGVDDPEPPGQELAHLGIAEILRKEMGAELLNRVERLLKQIERQLQAANGRATVQIPGTLLIVDDDPQIQRLLKMFFESRGMRVLVAGSGEEALKALAKKPSVVLLDVTMPGIDGVMTLERIRQTHATLPVIMATSIGDEATVRRALEGGAYDYVTKPFNFEYLETVVLTKVLLGMED